MTTITLSVYLKETVLKAALEGISGFGNKAGFFLSAGQSLIKLALF